MRPPRFLQDMPTSVVPKNVTDPGEPPRTPEQDSSPQEQRENGKILVSTSRWIDYDTHELLEMISELEDERRWARLREGLLWAVLVHILLISAITWIPKYIFHVPKVIDPFQAIEQRKDLKYLDLPPDLMKKYQSKVTVKPVKPKVPPIDHKTLEALNKPTPAPVAPPPPPEQPKTTEPKAQQPETPSPIPPKPQSQSQVEAPQPKAVPSRPLPNFAMGSMNPADQLREDMQKAAGSHGYNTNQLPPGPGLAMHPGAGTGGVEVLSDTQGVDFTSWLLRWHRETERTWDPLIPDEVNPPILKSGVVVIRFKVAPDGRLIPGSMKLEGRSGDTALDRAAWGALTGSSYPPLPRAFHGPYLELRAVFMYNMRPGQ